jgi:TonB family protein
MRTIGFPFRLALALCYSLDTTVAAAESSWSRVVREGPLEYRVGHVWTVGLSTDVEKVVNTLDEGAIPALVAALESDDERLVQGALWVLCQLSDKRAKAACTHYDAPPEPVSQPSPYYPHDAFGKRVEGTVEVRFLIGSSGHVTHAVVSKSVRMLDAAALHCVRRWTFRPAQRGGKPVPSVATAPASFRITGQR